MIRKIVPIHLGNHNYNEHIAHAQDRTIGVKSEEVLLYGITKLAILVDSIYKDNEYRKLN